MIELQFLRVNIFLKSIWWDCLQVCQAIDGLPDGSHVLSRIFAGASVYYNYTGNVDCFQPDDSGNIDLGTSGWNWQVMPQNFPF
jgi:hypothetical protein